MKNNNKSAFTIAELILTTVIMAIVCVITPVIILKKEVKPKKAKKLENIAECTIENKKCIFDAHSSTITYLKGKKGQETKLDYNKNTNEFYTIVLVGGGAGGTSMSHGYPGETKTIMIPTLNENKDITGGSRDEGKYQGNLTGYYLMEIGEGGEKDKNGKRTVFCTIPESMARNISSAECNEKLNKDNEKIVIIDSAEGGITSNENENKNENENENNNNDSYKSSIRLNNNDAFGNGGEKNKKGVGGLIIIK